ncbi:hypothetical protein N9B57_05405 [Verrucomicrobia bacterium]|nr:hypothetical protein [Verrucomicrobiota bacterium]
MPFEIHSTVEDANYLEHLAVDPEENNVFALGCDLTSRKQVLTPSPS